MANNEKEARLVLRLVDQISAPAKGIIASMRGIDHAMKSLKSANIGNLGAANRAAASMAASHKANAGAAIAASTYLRDVARYAGPAALAIGAQQTVARAADFESALTEIQKKAGASAAATARLGEEIKALAVSGDVASSIAEIAAAYERGAAAGIALDDLREFAALSVKGADAFGMSAEEVGNFAAKLRTGLGMTAAEVRQVLDLTNSLADAGIADERTLVEFMDRAGASLKTLGLAKEESLALGATLLNIGMASEVASTGMGALTGKLLTVGSLTGDARKAFEKVMGPVDDFAELVDEDANGALLKMLDTLKKLDKTQRVGFLKSFVGQEWADEMLRLVEATDEFRRNLRMAGDEAKWMGSLDASYALKLDDFWSQWQIAKNALEALTIDAGTMGMPAFKAGLEAARSLIAEVDKGLKAFRAEVDLTALGDAQRAIGELADAIGSLLQMGGKGSAIESFFDRLATTTNMVAGAIGAARDVAESLGLVASDDTPEERAKRRQDLVDDFAEFNPAVGPTVKRIHDNFGAQTMTPEKQAALDVMRPEGEQYDPGGDLSYRDWLEQKRARDVARLDAYLENAQQQAEGWIASRLDNLRAIMPQKRYGPNLPATPTPRPEATALPNIQPVEMPVVPKVDPAALGAATEALKAAAAVPVPTPRADALAQLASEAQASAIAAERMAGAFGAVPAPTAALSGMEAIRAALQTMPPAVPVIEAPVREESARALAVANEAGAQIAAAVSVSGRPTVDTSSIEAAIGSASRLKALLAGIGDVAPSVKGGRVRASAALAAAPSAGNLPSRAAGGLVRAGRSYLVGERGPEVATFGRTGSVTPNHRLGGDAAAGAVGPVTLNLTQHNTFKGATEAEARQAGETAAKAAFEALGRRLNRSNQISIDDRPII